jgi:hypothetical protein
MKNKKRISKLLSEKYIKKLNFSDIVLMFNKKVTKDIHELKRKSSEAIIKFDKSLNIRFDGFFSNIPPVVCKDLIFDLKDINYKIKVLENHLRSLPINSPEFVDLAVKLRGLRYDRTIVLQNIKRLNNTDHF